MSLATMKAALKCKSQISFEKKINLQAAVSIRRHTVIIPKMPDFFRVLQDVYSFLSLLLKIFYTPIVLQVLFKDGTSLPKFISLKCVEKTI